jgi:hypothetical protein
MQNILNSNHSPRTRLDNFKVYFAEPETKATLQQRNDPHSMFFFRVIDQIIKDDVEIKLRFWETRGQTTTRRIDGEIKATPSSKL